MKLRRELAYILLALIMAIGAEFLLFNARAQVSAKSQIVFVSDRGKLGQDIYVMDEDGQNVTRLTSDGSNNRWPSWSPDSQKITFHTDRDVNGAIYTMDSNGANLKKLTNQIDGTPSWSPNGVQIAFDSQRNGDSEIYVMDTDGKNPINLTKHGADDTFPAWSPDGSKIAFVSDRGGRDGIYVMDADGNNVQGLMTNPRIKVNHPSWSPEGRKIAYDAHNLDDNQETDIYMMDPDGTDIQRLTNDPAYDIDPNWLDDQRIVFVSGRDGNSEIYVMDIDGNNLRNLTNNSTRDAEPACWPGYLTEWSVSSAGKMPFTWGWVKKWGKESFR